MNTWHRVQVKYTKQFTDGTIKRVTEHYLINAINFTEAESRVHEEIGAHTRGEFVVKAIKNEDFSDIFVYDDAETFYSLKVAYISEDADSGKQKKTINKFLVQANNINEACFNIQENLKGLIASYELTEVKKSNIIEIYPYKSLED
jgi:hypothetical protein